MPAAMAVAEDYVGPPPLAVQTKKRVAIVSRDIPMANSRLVANLYGAPIGDTSHDAKEGPKAFVGKRNSTGELGNLGPWQQM